VPQHRLWMEVEGMQVPVLSLEYEVEAYRRMGRTERADMLERWLEERRQD